MVSPSAAMGAMDAADNRIARLRADNERLRRQVDAVRLLAANLEDEGDEVRRRHKTHGGMDLARRGVLLLSTARRIRAALDGAVPGDPAGTAHDEEGR